MLVAIWHGHTSLQVDRDVAEALAYFSQRGCISQPVMEASIFRAPYFVGLFLPSLLSPSLAEEASRNGLIAALTRSVCSITATLTHNILLP